MGWSTEWATVSGEPHGICGCERLQCRDQWNEERHWSGVAGADIPEQREKLSDSPPDESLQ
jgi:hypothetical protein